MALLVITIIGITLAESDIHLTEPHYPTEALALQASKDSLASRIFLAPDHTIQDHSLVITRNGQKHTVDKQTWIAYERSHYSWRSLMGAGLLIIVLLVFAIRQR